MYHSRQISENVLRAWRSPMICHTQVCESKFLIISVSSGGKRQVESCTAHVLGGVIRNRRLILALPKFQTITIRSEKFIPTTRTEHKSESFICADKGFIPDEEGIDSLERPGSLVGGVVILAGRRDASGRPDRISPLIAWIQR